ncbi:MAG: hypothetical protein WCE54_07135 [Ignavibacteriaceae bacterium]
MIKKIFFLVLLVSLISLAQDKGNPNVELPDFVITGRDIVSIQKAKKIKPEVVPTVSKDFFKPNYPPDALGIQDITNPVSNKFDLTDSLNIYNGYFELGLGAYTLPEAKAVYSIPFSNGIFNSYFNGNNRLNYISNASKSEWDGGINFSYFVDNDAPFFGGTKLKLHGNYGVSAFKFYGSNTPQLIRDLNTGDFSFDINNLINKNFIADAKISNRYTSLSKETFNENMLNFSAYTEANFSSFSLGADLIFKNQFLTISPKPPESVYFDKFFNIRPLVGLNISSLMKVKFGFNYAKSNNSSFFMPYGAIAMKFNKNLSLFGEINPHAEFISNGDFLRENRFNIPDSTSNVFLKKKFALHGMLKYEYDKYFEIDGGVDYYNAGNLPYFTDKNDPGKFAVSLTGANSYTAFINFLFHRGPYGIFYADAKLNSTKNSDGNIVPYYPQSEVSLVYGYYFFDNKLSTQVSVNYYSKQYTDIENTKSINPYFDAGLKFKYLLFSRFHLTLEVMNLFNYNNYLWNNYKEPPLNVIGGFSYQW